MPTVPASDIGYTDARASGNHRTYLMIFAGVFVLSVLPLGVDLLGGNGVQLLPVGMNIRWNAFLVWSHVATDLVLGACSVAIAIALFRLHKSTAYRTSFLWAFIGFGTFCGLAHILDAVLIWFPVFWLSTSIKYMAALSWAGIVLSIPPLLGKIRELIHAKEQILEHKHLLEYQNADLLQLAEALRTQIDERHAVEQRDKFNLERLSTVIQSLPMGASLVDENGTIIHTNRELLRMFRMPGEPEEYTGTKGKNAEIVINQIADEEKYRKEVDAMFTRMLDRPVLGKEIHFKDGRTYVRDVIPILIGSIIRGYLHLYRDVTRQQRLDRSKSEFMSLASHQLRTPLTVLKWSHSRLRKSLRQDQLEPQQFRLLQEAQLAAERMSVTINTMLAISRIEAGTMEVKVTDMKLGQVLHDLRLHFRTEIERKKLQFTINCMNNLVLHTDPYIFREILSNLFSNAIKYTPEGGSVTVHVDQDPRFVRLDVQDSGLGIPVDQQRRIFQKFFRADNVVQNDTEGSGLGLYLVHLLVKLVDSEITFESQEGLGTTFSLRFPWHLETAANLPIQAS